MSDSKPQQLRCRLGLYVRTQQVQHSRPIKICSVVTGGEDEHGGSQWCFLAQQVVFLF